MEWNIIQQYQKPSAEDMSLRSRALANEGYRLFNKGSRSHLQPALNILKFGTNEECTDDTYEFLKVYIVKHLNSV